MVISSASLNSSRAALEQGKKQYFRVYACDSSELVVASIETHYLGPDLGGIVKLVSIQ